jgi:hypothetical protein
VSKSASGKPRQVRACRKATSFSALPMVITRAQRDEKAADKKLSAIAEARDNKSSAVRLPRTARSAPRAA